MDYPILQNIQQMIQWTTEEKEAFVSILKIKRVKKKEFIIHEGQICNEIFFINSGCLRMFYNINGEERILDFLIENRWYTDYISFLQEVPTGVNVQALLPSEVVCFNKTDLYQLHDRYHKIERLGRIMAESQFIQLKSFYKMMTNESPEERYINLIKNKPGLVEKVSQKYIASFLQIRPETLSRIRKKIATKEKRLK